jgi:hypothetical protein
MHTRIYKKWNETEEALLRCGVSSYGAGNWAVIIKKLRLNKTPLQLKDKWRTLNFKNRSTKLREAKSWQKLNVTTVAFTDPIYESSGFIIKC